MEFKYSQHYFDNPKDLEALSWKFLMKFVWCTQRIDVKSSTILQVVSAAVSSTTEFLLLLTGCLLLLPLYVCFFVLGTSLFCYAIF